MPAGLHDPTLSAAPATENTRQRPTATATPSATDPSTAATHLLTVQPSGWQAPAAPQQSLLLAARAAGVSLPSACRNGTCRACLCRLVSGSIRYQIDWPGLLADEKADGWILPCVACATSNVVIDAPGAIRLFGA